VDAQDEPRRRDGGHMWTVGPPEGGGYTVNILITSHVASTAVLAGASI
jgi:hypothetical protein